MPHLMNAIAIRYLNRRISGLEAEQAEDQAFQSRRNLEIEIDGLEALIRGNNAQLEADDDLERWRTRNAYLLAEKKRLCDQRVPLPEASKKLWLKLRTYKLRRLVFKNYSKERSQLEGEVAGLDRASSARS